MAHDFKRAGIEIYRSIRSRGHASIRDYVRDNFVGPRNSPELADLWTLAQQIDFAVAAAQRIGGHKANRGVHL